MYAAAVALRPAIEAHEEDVSSVSSQVLVRRSARPRHRLELLLGLARLLRHRREVQLFTVGRVWMG